VGYSGRLVILTSKAEMGAKGEQGLSEFTSVARAVTTARNLLSRSGGLGAFVEHRALIVNIHKRNATPRAF
jgi:hypothetical protein